MSTAEKIAEDAADDAPITLSFDFTPDDFVAFYGTSETIDPHGHDNWNKIRRSYRNSIIIAVALTLLLIAGLTFNVFGMTEIDGRPVLAVVLAAAVAGAWWNVGQYRNSLKPLSQAAAAAHAGTEAVRYYLGPQTITIGPGGIRHSAVHHDIDQRWSGIADIRETDVALCFIRRDGQCYIIPKRILTDLPASDLFASAHSWLDRAGHGNRRAIREYLAENDAPCPACKYNLRGITADACPECGRPLDVDIIPGC